MPAISGNFGDLLDARFTDIFDSRFKDETDRISEFYHVITGTQNTERFSSVSGMGQLQAWSGTVPYDDVYQGYDASITPVEFALGFSIERKLVEDAQFNIMDGKPAALADAAARTRQYHAARPFNNAFSIDSLFASHSEGVSMCSNSHTTTTGASTAIGYDNLITSSLSAVSLSAARVQMLNFRDERGERMTNVMPDTILVPQQGSMEETAWEIIKSDKQVNSANNNKNFNEGRYQLKSWIYLDDANNWFLFDSRKLKGADGLIWVERTKPEFANTMDFDTMLKKWRVYGRWGHGYVEWRYILGASVS
jgi:hypothetical protein